MANTFDLSKLLSSDGLPTALETNPAMFAALLGGMGKAISPKDSAMANVGGLAQQLGQQQIMARQLNDWFKPTAKGTGGVISKTTKENPDGTITTTIQEDTENRPLHNASGQS